MTIHDYITDGGKNLIKEYLGSLPMDECREGYRIRHEIILHGIEALEKLNRRQLRGKLWEIKFSDNRIMYILADQENIYFLHACHKQKNKAEQFELDTAIQRAKEARLRI
jgi:phage-related protein